MKEGNPIISEFLKLEGRAVRKVGNGIKLEKQGQEAISEAKDYLDEGGSLLVYYNHVSIGDPYLIVDLIRDEFVKDSLSKTHFLTSRRHLDNRTLAHRFQSTTMRGVAAICKFDLIPLVQRMDFDIYPDHKKFNSTSIRESAEILRREPSSIIVLAPEGTRSKNKTLLEAEEILDALLRLSHGQAKALPIGITWQSDFEKPNGLKINFHSRATISVGNPISYQEVEALSVESGCPSKDVLMYYLATLLPEENRGYYK